MGFDDKAKAWRRLMRDIFKPRERLDSLLDVPCGKGELFKFSRRRAKHYFGVDPDPKNVKSARVRCTGGRVMQGDPLNIKLPSGRFDIVMSWGLIPALREDQFEEAIRELFRLSSKYVLFNWINRVKEDDKTPEESVPGKTQLGEKLLVRGIYLGDVIYQFCPTVKCIGTWQYGLIEEENGIQFLHWVSLYRKW